MSRCILPAARPRLSWWVHLFACLSVLAGLSGCGGGAGHHARVQRNPSRYYPPPGPASDPWGPYIHEASGRFGVPELWIRRVMRQESGGQEDVISWAGAMGLMQVMPDTYEGLRDRYNLGEDPFDPHNNILAGTAYLREMYDRYGSPGFLAAYNAGPKRLDAYLSYGRALPSETVNYVASIAPLLGPGTPASGPLAVYAGPGARLASRATASGCDPDAAYNPNGPCTPLRRTVVATAAAAGPVDAAGYGQDACDPDAAYDPRRPCQPMLAAPAATVSEPAYAQGYAQSTCDPDAAYDPTHPCRPVPAAPAATVSGSAYALGYAQGSCDPDAAYDPTHPCRPVPAAPGIVAESSPPPAAIVAQSLPPPAAVVTQPLPPPGPVHQGGYAAEMRPLQERMARQVAFSPEPSRGRWAIQVGAFANLASAQAAAEGARSVVPDLLRMAKIELPTTTPLGSQRAFRARLFGLTAPQAEDACARLSGRRMACIVVPPTRESF